MPKQNLRAIGAAYRSSMLFDCPPLFASHTTPKKAANLGLCALEYLAGRERVASWPIEATIEPTNTCNLRCPYCRTGSGEYGRPKGMMSMDVFRGIMNEIGDYLYLVSLFSHGEPFLSDDLLRMVRYARDKGVASMVHTNLNVKLDDERAGEVVKSGLTYLSASIDGATDDTYRGYRRGGSLETVLKNIDAINAQKAALKSRQPRLIWQYLLFKHNESELGEARKMARDRGMRFRVLFPKTPEGDRPASYEGRPTHRQGRGCNFPWTTANYAWDGSLVPCCQAYYGSDDLDGAPTGRFRRAWNNEKARAIRRYLSRHNRQAEGGVICHRCPEDYFWKTMGR